MLREGKLFCMLQQHINERILTDLKGKASLYVDGAGITGKQKNKK